MLGFISNVNIDNGKDCEVIMSLILLMTILLLLSYDSASKSLLSTLPLAQRCLFTMKYLRLCL